MRIEFQKTIEPSGLKPYLSQNDAVFRNYPGDYVTTYTYNLRQIETDSMNGLEGKFTTEGMDFSLTDHTNVWVSSPVEFALRLRANIQGHKSGVLRRQAQGLHGEDDITQNGTKPREYLCLWRWATKNLPSYVEVPRPVLVQGFVFYEQLEDVDPKPVLDVLKSADYGCKVVTTPEEIMKAMAEIKEITHSTRSYNSGSSTLIEGSLGLDMGLGL